MKVLLAVPKQNNCIQELNYFLSGYKADLYIFPEGFLNSDVLEEAIEIIKKNEKYVITGFKDLSENGQQKALAIDGGQIIGEYTKCILTKGEKQKGKKRGEIPLAFAFDPSGKCILLKQKEYGGFLVEINPEKNGEKVICYCDDRIPSLFFRLAEEQ